MDLLRQGSHEAFAILYERYWEKLLGIAYNRLKDLAIAEDIVHDVFACLWKRKALIEVNSLKSWMATAVKYMSIRVAEKKYREEPYKFDNSGVDDIEDSIDEQLLSQLLSKEINKLPEKCKVVFVLKQQGLSNKEIASEMGTSIKTVENQINRGMKALRTAFKAYLFSQILL